MKDLILFGMQGSGKGTQGQILAEKLGAQIFETGGQLRRLAAEDSELGRKIKSIIDGGTLVPTEVVMEMVADFLGKTPTKQSVIFDGIPRSEDQREQLEAEFEKAGRKPIAIYIKLTEEEALKRLLGRQTCSGCKKIFGAKDGLEMGAACPACGSELKTRDDDTEEAIRTRLSVYAEQTMPVIQKYRIEHRLIEADGAQPVEAVTAAIQAALEK